jgi:hypothetical protein
VDPELLVKGITAALENTDLVLMLADQVVAAQAVLDKMVAQHFAEITLTAWAEMVVLE